MLKFMKDAIPNIAQIILLVMILPLLCWVLSLIVGTQEVHLLLLDFIGQIDFLDDLIKFVSTIVQGHNSSLVGNTDAYLTHLLGMVNSLGTSIFQVLTVAICVNLCCLVCDIFKWKGMRILPTFLGVLLGYFVAKAYNMPLMTSAFLLLLLFVLDMIFVQEINFNIGMLLFKYLLFCIKMTLDILATIFMTGFVAVLLIICLRQADDLGMTIFMIIMFALPLIIVLAAKRYILPQRTA